MHIDVSSFLPISLDMRQTFKSNKPAHWLQLAAALTLRYVTNAFSTPLHPPPPHRRPWCCLRLVVASSQSKLHLNTHDSTFSYNYDCQRTARHSSCTSQRDVTRAELKKCKYSGPTNRWQMDGMVEWYWQENVALLEQCLTAQCTCVRTEHSSGPREMTAVQQ